MAITIHVNKEYKGTQPRKIQAWLDRVNNYKAHEALARNKFRLGGSPVKEGYYRPTVPPNIGDDGGYDGSVSEQLNRVIDNLHSDGISITLSDGAQYWLNHS